MRNLFAPGADPEAFLRDAKSNNYSMCEELVSPWVCDEVSGELKSAGYLVDYTELISTTRLAEKGMHITRILHDALNKVLTVIEGEDCNHIPLFSVRIFNPDQHGTTIHRNDSCIGPYATGIILKGEAPFNVYKQKQLRKGSVKPLTGSSSDPTPLASMDTCQGSAWTLYTAKEQMPHSSGLVESGEQRELLIFYNTLGY